MTDTDTERRVSAALTALAGPPPDLDEAWARLEGRLPAPRDQRGRRSPTVTAAAGLGAAAAVALTVLVIAREDDATRSLTVVPGTMTTTVLPPGPTVVAGAPSVTEVLPPIPAHPLVLTRGNRLEVWDGDTLQPGGVLTTAGRGRPEPADGFRITEVSVGQGVVAFTEEEVGSGRRSVWVLDLRSGLRRQVTTAGSHPAVSADGSTLAYVQGDEDDGGDSWAMFGIVDLDDGSGSPIGPGIPTSDLRLEWSPDGTRLLAEAPATGQIWVLRWLPDDVLLEESMEVRVLDGELRAASWVSDTIVYATDGDGWVQYDTSTDVVRADNSIVEPANATGVGPRGQLAYLVADDGRLVVPGGPEVTGVVDFDW